jgi:hypothetical protein
LGGLAGGRARARACVRRCARNAWRRAGFRKRTPRGDTTSRGDYSSMHMRMHVCVYIYILHVCMYMYVCRCVRNAWRRAGFRKTARGDWCLYWGKPFKFQEYKELGPFQKAGGPPSDCFYIDVERM